MHTVNRDSDTRVSDIRETSPLEDEIYERSASIRGVIPQDGRALKETVVDEESPIVLGETAHLITGKDTTATSQMRAFWNSLKVFAGAGTFALPWGFDQSGLGLGVIGYILIAALCYYVMRSFLIHGVKAGRRTSYFDLVGRAFGRRAEVASEILVVMLIFGVVCSYWILGASSLAPLIGVSYQMMVLIMLPVYMLLCFLPSLHSVAFASALGAVSLLLGMTIVIAIGFGGAAVWNPLYFNWWNFEGLGLFCGSVGFLFFVLPGLVPVSNSTSAPQKYPKTLGIVFLVCGIFNVIFAVVCEGLVQFDSSGKVFRTQQNILDNVPNGLAHDIVRVTLGLEMTLTFPVVMETVFQAIETEALGKLQNSMSTDSIFMKKPLILRNSLRTVVIGIVFVISLFVTQFGLFTSLVGSLLASHSTLTVPAIVALKIQGIRATPWYNQVIYVVSIAFATAMSVYGTYSAILGMLH